MSGESSNPKLLALLQLGDAFIEELQKENLQSQAAAPVQHRVKWWKRDLDGQRVTGKKRKKQRVSSAGAHAAVDPSPSTSMSTTYLDADLALQRLEELFQEDSIPEGQQPPLSSWCKRQKEAQQRWQDSRPQNLDSLLAAQSTPERRCSHCMSKRAVICCSDCMPVEWFCVECDCAIHKHHILRNRQTIIDGFYKYIAPSESLTLVDGKYTICAQECLLPVMIPPRDCCAFSDFTVSAGRPVILVCMNGRYDLHVPQLICGHCQSQWTPDVADFVRSGYWPTTMQAQTLFQQDLFESFQAMKTTAPGMSRQAFTAMLDQRTKHFGRTGNVNADAFQRSFLQYIYCKFEERQRVGPESFVCPACVPEQLVLSLDGNRKLYRFQSGNQDKEPGYFDGVFLAKDAEVSCFVEEVRGAVKSTGGKAMCGESHWTAARETSRKSNKLDEEGLEIAVCRHGFLLKGLNMFRGEIFAYPMFLQKQFPTSKFVAMDVTCRYFPYLVKVIDVLPHLDPLKETKPCLSVMHAKAHNTKCEITLSARNQEGVGLTIGEEVEQVNSFLSRCAVTTKYTAKSVRTDMLTVHAMGWNDRKRNNLHRALSSRYIKTLKNTQEATVTLKNMQAEWQCSDETLKQWVAQVKEWASTGNPVVPSGDVPGLQSSIETLFTSICQKKHYLYCKNDRNKKRKNMVHKISQLKQRLLAEIGRYNQLPGIITVDHVTVVQKLSSKSDEHVIWPWQEQNTDGVPLVIKKRLFDQQMLLSRLMEEKQILLKEMMQHCVYIRDSMGKAHSLMTTILNSHSESCMTGFSEEGSRGLICMLKRRLADLKGHKKTVMDCYRAILDSEPSLWFGEEDDREGEEMEIEEERDWRHDSSSDSEEDEEDEVQSC